jgi:hypothetical protein
MNVSTRYNLALGALAGAIGFGFVGERAKDHKVERYVQCVTANPEPECDRLKGFNSDLDLAALVLFGVALSIGTGLYRDILQEKTVSYVPAERTEQED